MRFRDLTYLSFQGINNRGSRFLFTVLGMAVALGVILFLVSLGFGLQALLLQRISTEESLLTLDVASPDPEVILLTPALVSEIAVTEGVERVSPQVVIVSQITTQDLASQSALYGVGPDFFSLSGLTSLYGRLFSEEDERVIVVNEATAELFQLPPQTLTGKKANLTLFVPVGEEGSVEVEAVEVEGTLEVVGVVAEPGAPSQVYIPLRILERAWEFNEYQLVKVKAENESILQDIREKLIARGLLVSALSETIKEANRIFRVVQIILGIFGVFALIVAAIGLINTMTITLLERTEEIGIMRAIGASPRNIQWLFLTESVVTGFIGGMLGIVLGIVFAEAFNLFVNILARALGGQPMSLFAYPLWFLVFILALSSLVGLVAGLWPARRAARLNPLDALRYK